MNFLKGKLQGAIAAFLLAGILLMLWFKFYVLNADNYFISIWGDGFKNYFTFAYYVIYDHGFHFTGMNYPFGEHVVFTDDQPLLAFLFKYLSHFKFFKDHLHQLFTYTTFLTVPLCAVAVFLILAEFEVTGGYVIISAALIALLSPQIIRLSGHFGLSHCFSLPLAFLFLIRASKKRSDIYLILFCATAMAFGFMHIYLLAIICFFGLTFAVLHYFTFERSRANFWFFIKIIAASVIPFLLIKVFMFLTDPVLDRPNNPWGFFDTCANFNSVFLPPKSFLHSFIYAHLHSLHSATVTDETHAYVGIVADLLLILIFVLTVLRFSLVRGLFKRISPALLIAFGASVILLLFSFGLPFTLFHKLYDYSGPLKQFRAPCRFSWPFYYMVNILGAVFLYYLFNEIKLKNWLRYTILCLVFILWFFDLNVVNNKISKQWFEYGGTIDTKSERAQIFELLGAKGFTVKDFQAILFLPYFTVGSEKSSLVSGGDMLGMKAALYTGLNMVDGEMSRTSLTQTDLNLQLISSPMLRKEVLDLYPSKLPLLLVMRSKERYNENEARLISKGDLIGSTFIFPDTLRFYSLPLTAFADSSAYIRDRYDQLRAEMNDHKTYFSTDPADNVISQGYENRKSQFVQFGSGALYLESKDTVLYDGILPFAKDSDIYEFSIWNYGDSRVPVYPGYQLEIYDRKQDLVAKYEKQAYASIDVYKKWIRTNIKFVLPSKGYKVKITGSGNFATYDELMIRPSNLNVLTHISDGKFFMYNNYPIEK